MLKKDVYDNLSSHFFVPLFLGMKINNIEPCQVEYILIENLDVNQRQLCKKLVGCWSHAWNFFFNAAKCEEGRKPRK